MKTQNLLVDYFIGYRYFSFRKQYYILTYR